MPSPTDSSLFIVSPRHHDELAAICAANGWPVTAIRDSEAAAAVFAVDPARVVVVDARGALSAGLAATADLARAVEARRGALLVLLSPGDAGAAEAAFAAGASQIVACAIDARGFAMAVHLALRARARLAAADSVERDDWLTGLPGAARARGWVETLIATGGGDPAAIVIEIAVGRVGQLNAAYGHKVADAALHLVGRRLRHVADTGGDDAAAMPLVAAPLVARLAGAEFALILAAPATLADAVILAARAARTFEVPFLVGGHAIHLGCRIGIAPAAAAPRDAAAAAAVRVFQHASTALSVARARAPGSIEVFDAPGDDSGRRMADLEADLRGALDAGQIDVLFQPQVETATGRIVGAEALVRWDHPLLGQLPAETLLRVADGAEVATKLGSHIQRQALAAAARWPAALAGLRLSINVTARDLAMPEFLSGLDAALAASGFPAARLTLEVTESDLIGNLDAAAAVLDAVRARGIEVALDDFGTGYSSLAYLKALPLDSLKVDKRLVHDLAGSSRDRVVVKGVVDMARALGICVVAEGIETEEQRERVAAAGCDWYQGFLCGPPLGAEALARLVGEWNTGAS